MWWLIGILVIIAAFAFPKFGKVLVVLVGVGVVAIWFHLDGQRREAEAAKHRISSSEVEFAGLELVPGYGGGSYQLRGRVKNRSSRYTLTGVQLRMRMDDCVRELTPEELSQIDELQKKQRHLSYQQRQALVELVRRRDAQTTPGWSRGCETVGDTVEHIFLSVPPGQSRDIDEYVSFSRLAAPRGEHVWNYTLAEVSGK